MEQQAQQGHDDLGPGGIPKHIYEVQPATSVKSHYALVNRILEYATQVLMKYKDKINILKQGLASMSKKIEAQYEDIKNKTTPTLEAMTRDLAMAIKDQKEENTKLQNQITELKKEKIQLQQRIIQCLQKVQVLEDQVGSYTR